MVTTGTDPWDVYVLEIEPEPQFNGYELPPSAEPEPEAEFLSQLADGFAPSPVDDHSFFKGLAKAVDPPEQHWRQDPVRWASERCKVELWSIQRTIIEAVRDLPRVAVPSCHNTGKSFLAATTALWWLNSHPPGDAFVLTTAPTGAQVKAILWRNINHMHAANDLIGRTNLTELYIGNEMVAMGRKPSEYDESAFQGIHALYVLVIIDEACGVPEDIWVAAETIASNVHSRILAIGNPDDPHSEFANVCQPGSGWKVYPIGFTDTPNSTGEDVSQRVKDSLISKVWAEGRRKNWGETSPLYISKVLGKFPEDTEDGVIAGSWVAHCRTLDGMFEDVETPRVGGLDVGAGGDETVLYARSGRHVFNRWRKRTKDPMELVGDVVRRIIDWDLERVVVDVIGVGWGVYGRLRELSHAHMEGDRNDKSHNAHIVPFNSAEAAMNNKKFINRRAELWWETGRELSRQSMWDLTFIDDDTAVELSTPKYKMTSRGLIQIESKDDIRKRIGRSTDNADALLMSFLDDSRVGSIVGSAIARARI